MKSQHIFDRNGMLAKELTIGVTIKKIFGKVFS